MLESRRPLKAKKPISAAKTPLKAKKPLLKKATAKKQVKPQITKLKKKADKVFSRMVRLRDSVREEGEWVGKCITCPSKVRALSSGAQAGHFMSRRYNATRYHPKNVNLQCYQCNVLFYGQQYTYAGELDQKYGKGTAAELSKLAKVSHPFTHEELETIISEAEEEIRFYENGVIW